MVDAIYWNSEKPETFIVHRHSLWTHLSTDQGTTEFIQENGSRMWMSWNSQIVLYIPCEMYKNVNI